MANGLQLLSSLNGSLYGENISAATVIDAGRAGRRLAECLFNQPLQSRIANTTLLVIEFH
jgi:hypothetical protein